MPIEKLIRAQTLPHKHFKMNSMRQLLISMTVILILQEAIRIKSMALHQNHFRKERFHMDSERVTTDMELPPRYETKIEPGQYCDDLIGCFDFHLRPRILLWRSKVEFYVHTRRNSIDQINDYVRIPFEEVVHHYVDDDSRFANFNYKHHRNYPFNLWKIENSGFMANLPTRILIGGWRSRIDDWIKEMTDLYLELEDCNVIVVSWPEANSGYYENAFRNIRMVGRQITVFLYYLDILHGLNLDNLHLIGHSLGAHIAGYVGLDYGGKIARITGLDPAGPRFYDKIEEERLDPSDAKFVDVMHTDCWNKVAFFFGIDFPSGHVDYYPNGGINQPLCSMSIGTCHHSSAHVYMAEIMRIAINNLPKQSRNRAREVRFQNPLVANVKPDAIRVRGEYQRLNRGDQPLILALRHNENDDYESRMRLFHEIEFQRMEPAFPIDEINGVYYFITTPERPFITTQLMISISLLEDDIVKPLTLRVRCNNVTFFDSNSIPKFRSSMGFIFSPIAEVCKYDENSQHAVEIQWQPRKVCGIYDCNTERTLGVKEFTLVNISKRNIMKYNAENSGGFTLTKDEWYLIPREIG